MYIFRRSNPTQLRYNTLLCSLQCGWLSHRVSFVQYCIYKPETGQVHIQLKLFRVLSVWFSESHKYEVISFLYHHQHTWLFPTARHFQPARAVAVGPHAPPDPSHPRCCPARLRASPVYQCTRSSHLSSKGGYPECLANKKTDTIKTKSTFTW